MEHYLPEVLFLHFSQMFLLMHLLCPLHWQSTSSGTKRLKYDLSLPSKGKHLFNKPTPILRQKSLCSCKFPTEETIVARLDIVNPLLTPPPPPLFLPATAELRLNFPLSSFLHFSTITFRLCCLFNGLKLPLHATSGSLWNWNLVCAS